MTTTNLEQSKISLWATILFVALLALLHVIKPEINPAWRFISEYALGKNGWLMNLTFFAWASAYLFLFFTFRKHLKTIVGKIGLVMLLISSAGLLLAGIFTTDAITTETHTTSGTLHNLGGTLGMAMPLSALFICIAIWKNPLWVGVRRSVLWATIFALIGFVVSAGSLGYMFSQSNGKPGPDVWVGLPTRFEILTYCLWLITVSRQTSKITQN